MTNRNKIVALVLSLLLFLAPAAKAQPLFTDAGLQWGMSREQVLAKVKAFGATEESAAADGSTLLTVRGLALCGFSMEAWCRFDGDALSSVTYLLPADFTLNAQTLRQSLQLFRQRISAVYGEPAAEEEDRMEWKTSSFVIIAAVGDCSALNGKAGEQISVRFASPMTVAETAVVPSAQQASVPAAPADGSVLMTVEASEKMDYDHTAGERWNRSFSVNGQKFFGDTTLRVREGDQVVLGATVTDSDGRPDVGTGEVIHTVTGKDLTEGFTEVFKVQITENEGARAGSDARFTITFRFVTPQGKAAPYAGAAQPAVQTAAPVPETEKETVRTDGAVLMTVRAWETMVYDRTAGERWNRSFMVNSQKFYGDTQVYVKAGDVLTLAATVTDSDDRPDFSTGSVEHTVTAADLTNGFTEGFKVRVAENEGPLAGKEAMFEITFTFASPGGKIAPAAETPAAAAAQGTAAPIREDGAVMMRVNAKETLEKNAGVGDRWNRSFTVNGEKFFGETTVWVMAGDVLSLTATVTESDDHPDRATAGVEHLVTEADLAAGFTETFQVTVEENEGDNAGRKAVWNITFTLFR